MLRTILALLAGAVLGVAATLLAVWWFQDPWQRAQTCEKLAIELDVEAESYRESKNTWRDLSLKCSDRLHDCRDRRHGCDYCENCPACPRCEKPVPLQRPERLPEIDDVMEG